jgi:prolyl-tRNA synthetase
MRLSRFFLPILRETPKEAEIVSHRLMLRAGMMRQEAAGIYAFLPLGFRVLQKICQIVREEQNRSGAIELLMPMARRCCALRTDTSETCSTVRPTRK